MGTRGRKSISELTTAPAVAFLPQRPEPPADLSAAEAVEWAAIVHRLPADWFPRETHGLLSAYCRHIVAGRRVAKMIEAADDGDVPGLARLLRMQVAQSAAIATLSAKMRLTQSATVDRRKTKGPTAPKPWE